MTGATLGVARWLPPAVRDAPAEAPPTPRLLDELLRAVDVQRLLLEADVDQVWEDLFIDSCADWAVPYIGALVGLQPDADRAEVANAIALRRRKGTPAAFESFAEVLTGWAARAIEGWQVTVWAQRPLYPPPLRVASVDLRDSSRYRIGTPFERTRRSVSPSGRWAPRTATAVVWPWRVRSYRQVEAAPRPEANRFALHPLGAEAPLYLSPRPLRVTSDSDPDEAATRTMDERDAPVRATYRVLEALAAPGEITYGTNWTVAATHPLAGGADPTQPPLLELTANGVAVPWTALRFGSLPDGAAAPAPPGANEDVLDVSRGRVELGSSFAGPVRTTWHRPAPGFLGAFASTVDANPAARKVVVVDPAAPAVGPALKHTLADAFAAAQALTAPAPDFDPTASRPGIPDVEIRLQTSDRLDAPPAQSFTPNARRWRIIAPGLTTPTIVGDLSLNLAGGCLSLEGFQLDGDLRLGKDLAGVDLRNVTIDPANGRTLRVDKAAWGLELSATSCLLGPIRADLAAVPITLTDCVVDGRGASLRVCGGSEGGGTGAAVQHVATFDPSLSADGVTFVGATRLEAVSAVDCIFEGGVTAVQQQEGCLRNCYLGPDLTTPPSRPMTYRCGPFPTPDFVSIGFEAAGYYTLALEPDHPLLSAASNGGEVGAYHHARRAARLARLRRRIHEFVPLGVKPSLALAPWEE